MPSRQSSGVGGADPEAYRFMVNPPDHTSQAKAKRALITGITGQGGSYLAELLLAKGYEICGILRRSSTFNTGHIDQIYQDPHVLNPRLRLVYGYLNDASSLNKVVRCQRTLKKGPLRTLKIPPPPRVRGWSPAQVSSASRPSASRGADTTPL